MNQDGEVADFSPRVSWKEPLPSRHKFLAMVSSLASFLAPPTLGTFPFEHGEVIQIGLIFFLTLSILGFGELNVELPTKIWSGIVTACPFDSGLCRAQGSACTARTHPESSLHHGRRSFHRRVRCLWKLFDQDAQSGPAGGAGSAL